jgi:hypothetical protein
MQESIWIKAVQDLIAGGDLERGIQLLRDETLGSAWALSVVQLNGRYAELMQQKMSDTLSFSEANTVMNKIRRDTLQLLEQIRKGQAPAPGETEGYQAGAIIDSKNVLQNVTIIAQGDVHIGDKK